MKAPILSLTGDTRILDKMKRGDEHVLVKLYESNRRPISNLISRNSGTQADAEDVLQESLVVLWERVRSGRFEQNARIGTFLYATARNLWFARLRKKGREVQREVDPEEHLDEEPSPLEVLVSTEEAALVGEALENLGEQCRKLLQLFYWEELPMGEIANALGLANAATAKAKKYQCKKALEKALSFLQTQ